MLDDNESQAVDNRDPLTEQRENMPSTSVLPTQDMQHQINKKEKKLLFAKVFAKVSIFRIWRWHLQRCAEDPLKTLKIYISQDQISLLAIILL